MSFTGVGEICVSMGPNSNRVCTKVFGAMFGKGWVQRYLIPKGIEDVEEQEDVVRGMLAIYFDAMKKLQDKCRNFLVVETRMTLSRRNPAQAGLVAR